MTCGRHRRLESFALKKKGHVYIFSYPPEYQSAAIKAFASCRGIDKIDAIALACYLGRDPRELGLADE